MHKNILFLLSSVLAALASNIEADSKAMVGTNLGGWLVLEPWITPTLFYRSLNKTKSEGVPHDSYTMCETYGPDEGNKLMRAHWEYWITEQHFMEASVRGLEVLRVPVGDWHFEPYGPYVGCMDGSLEKLDWAFEMAKKYDIKILLDIHSMIDSQNGFDNSG
jgi:glucan 1,3-beta-glucosidase